MYFCKDKLMMTNADLGQDVQIFSRLYADLGQDIQIFSRPYADIDSVILKTF